MTEYDPYDVFDIVVPLGRRDEAPEHLAEPLISYNIEITIALPQNCKDYRYLPLLDKIKSYANVFENIKAEYRAQSGFYTIEYHANGEPHLHGYLDIQLHVNTFTYDIEDILKMIARSIFLKLPKVLFKQFAKADVNPYLKRFKSPAVCLNIKNVLQKEWVDYINKNALK